MLQSGYIRFILVWLIVHCMVSGVISSHFRGGIFMVAPKPGGTQREVSLVDKVFGCITVILMFY